VTAAAALALHAALMLAAAPVLAGLRAVVQARLLGRAGPALLQPWRDLERLLRKQPVLPETASWLFAAAPFACLVVAVAAALLVPSFALGMATAPLADLVVLAGLLAAGRFALALAGYEDGTALGGMGASRIGVAAVCGEPATLLVILVLATLAGTSNLDAISAVGLEGPRGVPWIAAGAALAIAGFAVIGRRGQGPPLTLMHEAVALDYSGPYLAIVAYAGQLSALVSLSVLAAVFLPFGIAAGGAGPLAWAVGAAAWIVKVGALGTCLAALDAVGARPALARVPAVLGLAALLAFLAAMILFAGQGPA